MSYTTFEEIKHLSFQSGAAWILRHAARHPILDGSNPDDAMLTGEGIRAASRLGAEITLHRKIGRVFCSPVQRCIDTGRAILLGAGSKEDIILKWWLYTPFLDIGKNGKSMPDTIQVNISGFKHTIHKNTLKMILNQIKIPAAQGCFNLYITHDSTIQPIFTYLTGSSNGASKLLPDFLQGSLLLRQDGHIRLWQPPA